MFKFEGWCLDTKTGTYFIQLFLIIQVNVHPVHLFVYNKLIARKPEY